MLASGSVLVALVFFALYGLPFVRVAPNRLVSGQPVYFFPLIDGQSYAPVWVLALLVILLFAAAFKTGMTGLRMAMALALALIPALLWLAASQATSTLQGESSIARDSLARTSLGSAFWVSILFLGLIAADALQRMRATPLKSALAGVAVLLAVASMLAAGVLDDLSIVKEYAVRADGFTQVLVRHLQIVFMALAFTLVIGLPMGLAAHGNAGIGKALFPALNIIQTIPSIALFGLLMAPLALLAASVPVLGRAGISGVGLAPAVIVLTLYGLLPVVRGTLAGLQRVPVAMIHAARGLGLKRYQVFIHVELPLALPVVLGGVRTAAVASVGLAGVTALIGAGGLGSIMFEGLFSNAQDVVLLGVLPIIALGVLLDALFKALIGLARHRARAP
ncbi:MAG: ABC transporter permease [Polaromonas sp.]|nr:ABC transporter permease [Polaromonas sp.]